MGKAVLLLVLTATMVASALYISRDGTFLRQKQEEADYQAQVMAREAANSAFNIIVGRVKRDFDNPDKC